MTRKQLSEKEVQDVLASLSGWQLEDGKFTKQYKFDSFSQALGWMVAVGIEADKMNHHPEWANVYNRVSVSLVTHDLGNKISSWDVALAQIMDKLAG